MLKSIANLLASSTSVKFQMLPHESLEDNYRMIISPLLNAKKFNVEPSKQSSEAGKQALQAKNALITPFTIVGTIDELEVQLPIALAQINHPRIEAKNNLDTLMASLNKSAKAKPAKPNKEVKLTDSVKTTPTAESSSVEKVTAKDVKTPITPKKVVKQADAVKETITIESVIEKADTSSEVQTTATGNEINQNPDSQPQNIEDDSSALIPQLTMF